MRVKEKSSESEGTGRKSDKLLARSRGSFIGGWRWGKFKVLKRVLIILTRSIDPRNTRNAVPRLETRGLIPRHAPLGRVTIKHYD